MRRLVLVALSLFAIVLIVSCKKVPKTASVTKDPLYIPLDLDTLLLTFSTPIYNGVPIYNMSGVLVACRMSGSPADSSGRVNAYNRNWETAFFADPTGTTLTNAGTVSVNTTSLGSGVVYSHNDTTAVWNELTLNHWNVSGSGGIPAIAAVVDGTFPSFYGVLPVNVSKSMDFSFTFDTSNNINGDSAYVVIYYYGNYAQSKVVNAKGGTANIPSSYLINSTNGCFSLSGDPYYYGGKIILVIYNHTIQTIGGKQFAFVKQREILGAVKFL
jgi:hypothetical protein